MFYYLIKLHCNSLHYLRNRIGHQTQINKLYFLQNSAFPLKTSFEVNVITIVIIIMFLCRKTFYVFTSLPFTIILDTQRLIILYIESECRE